MTLPHRWLQSAPLRYAAYGSVAAVQTLLYLAAAVLLLASPLVFVAIALVWLAELTGNVFGEKI